MSGINTVVLVGRPTRDIEIKFTAGSGIAVVSLNLAVERKIKDKTTGKYEADFIPCVIWGKAAELVAEHSAKGKLLGITGRIQTRNYEKDGHKVYITEVVAEQVQIIEWASSGAAGKAPGSYNSFEEDDLTPVDDGDIPF